MKKFIVIIIISVVVVSLVILSWHSIAKFYENHKMLEKDEIIEIFEKNKEHFENTKNTMSDFRYDWNISKNAQMISGGYGAWKGCATKGKLYLAIRRPENYGQLDIMKKAVEEEESIKNVLKELGFMEIQYTYRSDSEYIDFTQYASTGNVSGVIYCFKGIPTSHPYAHKTVDLGDGWYYYETRRGDE